MFVHEISCYTKQKQDRSQMDFGVQHNGVKVLVRFQGKFDKMKKKSHLIDVLNQKVNYKVIITSYHPLYNGSSS